MASSSSSRCSQKHDVFLSFRGEDTRVKFTSHLHAMLRQKSIDTYIDDRLEKGDGISKALLEAIRGSKMSVVVLSVNYATSSWCLDEVLCIVECMRERGQVVVPVFYEVEPTNVRHQSGSYETAFSGLKERFKDDKVNEWKAALTEVANLSGFTSLEYGTDSELVEAIVNDIVKKLNGMSARGHFKDLIGIEKSVEEMKNLLCIDSRDVRVIGILGMGGLGKTTLARVIFERLFSDFEACCFLQNIREKSEKLEGLEELKKQLFSVVLGEKDLNDITGFHEDRLRRKKVLIVLDDVDQPEQLGYLAGDHNWFGDGSRVIVTTRDAQVLRDRAYEKYELKGLNDECALELFNMNAFKGKSPTSDDIDLSKRVVYYTKGIPLALKVLGSFLRSKRRENWEIELNRLKEVPNKAVQNALKISYDGLDEQEQRVFLDIVCFVEVAEGTCRHYVERILGGDRSLKSDIDSLIDKSLIFEDHNYLRMHDLVTEMGREIVRQQSVPEPGKRSRLWVEDDCYHVLQNNTGTVSIEGISLAHRSKLAKVSHAAFKEMHRLRYLKIVEWNVKLTQELENVKINAETMHFGSRALCKWNMQLPPPLEDCPKQMHVVMRTMQPNHQLEYLPSALKYLEWSKWPFKSMPRNFSPRNLVELRMRESMLQRLWTGDQKLGNLKHVDLSGSVLLTDVSALSQAPNLESVNLSFCKNLRQVPSLRFGDLGKRNHKCGNKKCTTLGHVNLHFCIGVEVILRISGCVKRLDLSYCLPYKELPSELIEYLSGLEELDLSYSKMLEHFPTSICKLKYLKRLSLNGCNISEIPSAISCLSFLEELDLSRNPIRFLPLAVKQLCKLRTLLVWYCVALKFLPELPLSLEVVAACGCATLRTVWIPRDDVLQQQEPWTDYHATRSRQFLFLDCPLDQETCLRILKEFQLRVLRTAAAVALNNIKELHWPTIQISFTGNKIPEWFTFRSEKETQFVFKLSPQWHNSNCLGCAVAFVTEKEPFDPPDATYNVHTFLLANNNKIDSFHWCFGENFPTRGSNVFMFYNYGNYHNWRYAEQVMITFSFKYGGNLKVTGCGFRPLYLHDYETEFGKSKEFFNKIVFLP